MDDNSLGMKTVRFEFTEDGGVFAYENATGKHELKFALGEQLETTFPETHYFGKRRTDCGDIWRKRNAHGSDDRRKATAHAGHGPHETAAHNG